MCFERGYQLVTVPALCARAGVQRAEFDAIYDDIDDCFCDAYSSEFRRYRENAEAARVGLSSWRERVRATAHALHGYLAEDERVTHFTVIEVRRGPEPAQRLIGEGIQELIDLLDEGRAEPGAPPGLTRATAESVAGGIFNNLFLAVGHGETPSDSEPIGEFMYAAVLPYLGATVAREELEMPPPRLQHPSLPNPRNPVDRALIDLCFERGFAAVEVDGLCRRAGVERSRFEREFADLDHCFCAVFENEMDLLLLEFNSVLTSAEGWRERLRAVAYAFQRWLAADPARTHLMVTEIRTAPECARLIRARGIERMIDLLDEGRGGPHADDHITRATAEALAGGILATIYATVAAGELISAEGVPDLLYTALLPYLGHEAAAEEIRIPPPGRPGQASRTAFPGDPHVDP